MRQCAESDPMMKHGMVFETDDFFEDDIFDFGFDFSSSPVDQSSNVSGSNSVSNVSYSGKVLCNFLTIYPIFVSHCRICR